MIDREALAQAAPRMIERIVGGRDVVVALLRQANGESVRRIAADTGENHVTTWRHLQHARHELRQLGLPTRALEAFTPHGCEKNAGPSESE